jgi:hypothetical protein
MRSFVMPIETRWYLEDRVAYARLSGVVTDADLQAMDAWMIQCMETSPAMLVHHIIDAKDITQPTSARQAMQLKAPRHAKMGWGITIGINLNPMLRFLTALIVSVARIRYRDVNTFDEALAQLQTFDPNLPDLAQIKDGFIRSKSS